MKKYSVMISAIGLFALVGCGQSLDEPSNTHVFSGFGYSIDYPEGWMAETRATVTVISELEEDHARAFRDERVNLAGYGVALDHRRDCRIPSAPCEGIGMMFKDFRKVTQRHNNSLERTGDAAPKARVGGNVRS